MNNNGKILAIDFGESYVGLAITDAEGLLVFPKGVIKDFRSLLHLFGKIEGICLDERVGKIVFGIPTGVNGEATDQTIRMKRIGSKLEDFLKNIQVVFQDEAYTSFEARNIANEKGLNKVHNKYSEHELAAMIILERYIENCSE